MSENMNEGLKKALYTGVGIAVATADVAGKAVDTFAKKGEQAIQKSKVLNEELRRRKAEAASDIKDITDSLEKLGRDQIVQIKAKLAEVENASEKAEDEVKMSADAILAGIEKLSKDEIEAVKTKLAEITEKWTDDNDKGDEG